MLKVKEVFYSLQGEGLNAGRPAIFVRFSGCNLWSGREQDRTSSVCSFCDTDFVGGTTYTEGELVTLVDSLWPSQTPPLIIFTGGEPTLQLRDSLLDKFNAFYGKQKRACSFALETNGTTDVVYKTQFGLSRVQRNRIS